MRRFFNGFRYVFFFLFNLFLMLVFHSYLNFVILVGMLAFLVYSVCGVYAVRKSIDLQMKLPLEPMYKGESFQLMILVHNPTIFPLLNAEVSLTLGNSFYSESGTHILTVPVRAKNETKIIYPVTMDLPGRFYAVVDGITIVDLLGIIVWKLPIKREAECLVFPRGTQMFQTALSAYARGVSEASESTGRGYDFSEISGIREYIPGDKLQNIHWKLSVKKDELMVKERVSVSAMQLNIVIELTDNDIVKAENVLDVADGVIRALVESNLAFTVYYYSVRSGELKETSIGNETERNQWMELLLYDSVYPENGKAEEFFVQRNVNGNPYLYIGCGKEQLCTLVE